MMECGTIVQTVEKFRKAVETYGLIKPGGTVLVGVSGGADSMCLLDLFCRLRHSLGIHVVCAHVNHHLRRSSDGDERFVQKFSKQSGVPFISVSLKLKKSKGKSSIEETAREARLKALVRLAQRSHADSIALAHQQDDAAETVLMRVLRGTGLQGLQGILPRRKIYDFPFIRPLLDLSRKDIEAYLRSRHLTYRTDPTNRQLHFFRNRIRLELLPLLERRYQSNCKTVLANLAQTAALDYDYLRKEAQRILARVRKKTKSAVTLNIAAMKKIHPALRRMLIRLAVEELQGDLHRLTLMHLKEVEDLIDHRPQGAIVHLPDGLAIGKNKAVLSLCRE